MPEKVDHRRATAVRNAAAILDATERLLANGSTLSMAATYGVPRNEALRLLLRTSRDVFLTRADH
jgi:hypothetical protein